MWNEAESESRFGLFTCIRSLKQQIPDTVTREKNINRVRLVPHRDGVVTVGMEKEGKSEEIL